MSSFHIVPKSFFFKVHVQSKTPLGLFRWSTSFCTALSTHLKTPKVVVASRWHVNTSLFCHKKQNTIAYNNSLVYICLTKKYAFTKNVSQYWSSSDSAVGVKNVKVVQQKSVCIIPSGVTISKKSVSIEYEYPTIEFE